MVEGTEPVGSPRTSWWQSPVLILVGVLTIALNLRLAAVSVGPLLATIRPALGMNGAVAGLVTTVPVICFAVFGALSPMAAARLGMHRVLCGALVLLVTGQLVRATTDSPLVFLVASMVALSGMAAANVLLPSVIKLHFAHRVGLVTALYSTALSIGVTLASVVTVPLAQAFGSWRWGLGLWATTAFIALLPWLALVRHDRRDPATGPARARAIGMRDLLRSPLAWTMVFFFAVQSAQAYIQFGWYPTILQAAGYSAAEGGFYLGVIAGVGIPLAFLMPALAARLNKPYPLMVVIASCLAGGYLGVLLNPTGPVWLWSVLLAVGVSAFPFILALIGLRARTSEGTAALSGFTQSIGYLVAAPFPFLIGLLHDLTGSWTVPVIVMMSMSVPLLLLGLSASRPRFVEDELAHRG